MQIRNHQFPFLVRGKFGNVVGRVVNGKQFFSKLPKRKKKEPTLRELQARQSFTIASQFLKPIVPLLRKYDEPNGRSGFHKAISLVLLNAIVGEYPDRRINFSQVVLGEGSVPIPEKYEVVSPAKGLLEFTWAMRTMRWMLRGTDRIFVVVYCELRHQFSFELSGTERRERQFQMDVSSFSGQTIEVYFGFASSDGLFISTSVYAGSIKVL